MCFYKAGMCHASGLAEGTTDLTCRWRQRCHGRTADASSGKEPQQPTVTQINIKFYLWLSHQCPCTLDTTAVVPLDLWLPVLFTVTSNHTTGIWKVLRMGAQRSQRAAAGWSRGGTSSNSAPCFSSGSAGCKLALAWAYALIDWLICLLECQTP